MDTRRHNITNTATEVLPDLGEGSALIKNAGDTECFVGGDGVTAAGGFSLEPGETLLITNVGGAVSAITASGTTIIHVLYGAGS